MTHVLLTHKHYDHSGGNKSLLEEFSNLIVVGSLQDFPENSMLNHYFYKVNKRVEDSEILMVGRLCFKVLIAPCHTRGSVMYLLEVDKIEQDSLVLDRDLGQILDLDVPSLFSGDTIFTGGIGMSLYIAPAGRYNNLRTSYYSFVTNLLSQVLSPRFAL